MDIFAASTPLTKESKDRAVQEVIASARPDAQYYLLVIAAIMLAIGGILTDSIPVLVASMLVAPLSSPLLGMALGIVSKKRALTARSFGMLIVSIVCAFVLSVSFGFVAIRLFGIGVPGVHIGFSPNYFFDIAIGLLGGFLATYGLFRAKIGSAIHGVGIAVSLMPPMVATGIGFATTKIVSSDAFIIFGLNVVSILAASIATFLLVGIRSRNR